jgi:hypothetical protein
MGNADEMRELLSRWEISGVIQRAFAEQEGVPHSTSATWHQRTVYVRQLLMELCHSMEGVHTNRKRLLGQTVATLRIS